MIWLNNLSHLAIHQSMFRPLMVKSTASNCILISREVIILFIFLPSTSHSSLEILSDDLSVEITSSTTQTSNSIIHTFARSSPSSFLESGNQPEDGTAYFGMASSVRSFHSKYKWSPSLQILATRGELASGKLWWHAGSVCRQCLPYKQSRSN